MSIEPIEAPKQLSWWRHPVLALRGWLREWLGLDRALRADIDHNEARVDRYGMRVAASELDHQQLVARIDTLATVVAENTLNVQQLSEAAEVASEQRAAGVLYQDLRHATCTAARRALDLPQHEPECRLRPAMLTTACAANDCPRRQLMAALRGAKGDALGKG